MSEGVDARNLSEDDLRRELAHAKGKASDIESDGTPHQKANLESRTAQLEQEFLRRNPSDTPTDDTSTGDTSTDDTSTGDTSTDDTTADDAPAHDAVADQATTDDSAPDDSAPGAAAESSAPAVSGEPEHDPTRPEDSV